VPLSRTFADLVVESDFRSRTRRRVSGTRFQRPNGIVCASRL